MVWSHCIPFTETILKEKVNGLFSSILFFLDTLHSKKYLTMYMYIGWFSVRCFLKVTIEFI